MTARAALAALYRRVVPEPIRRRIRNRLSPGGYSAAFFRTIDERDARSFSVMASTIIDRLAPSSVVDVGCGSGALLAELARRGVRTRGLEGSEPGVASTRRRGIEVQQSDLTKPFVLDETFDVATSFEVAEHLPESVADQFVAGLTSGPDLLVFSAATPGQGGENHINEQPHEYWIEKFAARGFAVDEQTTAEVRAHWTAHGVARWYCNNVLFLRRTTGG